MNPEPLRLRLYSDAKYVGSRPELAPIAGERVAVIERSRQADGSWLYGVVTNQKTSPVFHCLEHELVPLAPLPLTSDEEHMAGIVAQTADLRCSEDSRELRRLLRERGVDPSKCLQLSCDQGDDVYIVLVLPDGTVVGTDYRWDGNTRQATKIETWDVMNYGGRVMELCRQALSATGSVGFDQDVRAYVERVGLK